MALKFKQRDGRCPSVETPDGNYILREKGTSREYALYFVPKGFQEWTLNATDVIDAERKTRKYTGQKKGDIFWWKPCTANSWEHQEDDVTWFLSREGRFHENRWRLVKTMNEREKLVQGMWQTYREFVKECEAYINRMYGNEQISLFGEG